MTSAPTTSNPFCAGFPEPVSWAGCQVLTLQTSGVVLNVSEAGVLPVICVDGDGNVRGTRQLVISKRKGVSLT